MLASTKGYLKELSLELRSTIKRIPTEESKIQNKAVKRSDLPRHAIFPGLDEFRIHSPFPFVDVVSLSNRAINHKNTCRKKSRSMISSQFSRLYWPTFVSLTLYHASLRTF